MIERAINWLIPPELTDRHEQGPARRAIVLGSALTFWAPVFSPIFYLCGSPTGGVICLVATAALLAAMLSMRFTRSVILTGHLLAFATFGTLTGLATVTGGPGSPSLWWLPAVPIVGLIICGIRSGVAWAVISCLACLAFFANDYFGMVTLADEIGGIQLRLLNSAATAGIILCAFSLTLAFKLSEDDARHELEVAQQESEAANQAKSQFLANMSHEIRTPMNAVIGLTELVLDSELEKENRDYLSTVLESGESLLTIINEILDFSKIEAGKVVLESVPMDVRAELHEIKKSLMLRATRKQLELDCIVDENVPRVVLGDPARLRQVLINLTANSIKFTESGSVTVAVHAESFTDNRAELCFAITDTGVGIPAEKLGHIFCEFEQADTSTTRQFGGTGLGLSISSRLVSLMGGQIDVESELGRGSKFHFSIPLEIGAQDELPEPSGVETSEDSSRRATESFSAGLKILLAEDGLANQKYAAGLLKKWGHEVVIADNGRAAVEQWEQGAFDLILMDIQMPELDGIGATKMIRDREQQRGGHIPIIALTAHALKGDREKCLAQGMDGYVSKPIRRTELADEIEPLLHRPL